MSTPGSSGKRAVEGATYITPRALYRNNYTGAGGEVDPLDDTIPTLDTRYGPNTQVGLGEGDNNQYGQNAKIMFYVFVGDYTSVSLRLWMKAPVTIANLSTVDPEDPVYPADTDDWVQVALQSFSPGGSMWVVDQIPPGQYKVLVEAVEGGSSSSSSSSGSFVTISEQHAA